MRDAESLPGRRVFYSILILFLYVAGLALAKPGRVAKFEGGADASGDGCEELGKDGLVGFEVGRKLEEDGAEALGALQRLEGSEEALEEFFRAFEALDVGENLVGLDGEAEVVGRVGQPVLDGCFFDELAEGEVDLDRVELGGVEAEEFFLGEFFGIEGGLPGWIRPSGGADVERHGRRSIADFRLQIAKIKTKPRTTSFSADFRGLVSHLNCNRSKASAVGGPNPRCIRQWFPPLRKTEGRGTHRCSGVRDEEAGPPVPVIRKGQISPDVAADAAGALTTFSISSSINLSFL